MIRILFVGPIVHSNDVKASAAVSPAANQWQLDLIKGLIANSVNVSVLTYLPEPAWPKGSLLIKNTPFQHPICKTTYIPYVNVPGLRFTMLENRFIKALTSMIDKGTFKPDILVTYNATEANCALGHFFQQKYHGKWISIIADGYSQGNPDSEIFLSYGYYLKSTVEPKLHLDGAPPTFQGKEALQIDKKIILYSGSLDIWTGIQHFVKQFADLNHTEFELHIYGKGENKEIERLATIHENIKLMGFVSSEELSTASQIAYAFINPRPTHLPGVENNFPSKLLQYISFGKPIISTKTDGISPLYNDLLMYYNPLDIITLRAQLVRLNNLSVSDLSEIYKTNKIFCETNTWKDQAAKVVLLSKKLLAG